VKRAVTVCVAMVFMIAVLAMMAMPAFAAINHPNNNGHPSTNPAGKCPAGQNKGATPGALHKCK
jgi:hypothetical protein